MSEHQTVEWKEAWRDEHLRWICGFANADGGTLVVGRNDRGEVVGVADARRLLEEIPNKVRDLLGIVVAVHLRTESQRELIEIVVEPSPTPISYRGEYHVRSGSTKQELRGPALSAFLLRRLGRHWDGAPVPGVAASDLDAEALRTFRARAARSDRMEEGALPDTDAELIERLHLTDGEFLKRAAILLFHRDPERFVAGAAVKIGFFESDAEILYHDRVEGGLFRQVSMTLEILNAKYLRSRISYEGIQRIETPPVPDAALREAVLNAVIHKDYSVGSPVQIRVYDDRLMIWNAGQLPPSWTAATLMQKHPSQPPNPDIANAFFRLGMIETWGRGIEKMLRACSAAGVPKPGIRADETGIWVEFEFASAGQVAGQVTGQVAGQVGEEVLRVLQALEGEMSRAQLQQRLHLKSRANFEDRYLKPALAGGVIELTVPEKPNSRLQKYRLSAAGKAALAARRKA